MSSIKDRQTTRNKYLINLNNFTVIKKIKSGGFGSVYHIKDKSTKKEYAAKILPTDENEQSKKMINREIGIMIRLQHPTIIQFLGYSLKDFDNHDNVTIIMDIAKNGSLSTLLESVQKGLADPLYDNTARQKILIGISYGMMHLHRNHIIHRDLKPGNVLIDENLNPHITDFGLSKIYHNDHSQSQTQAYGTSIYMAPEVIRGDRYNGKADVYSFGILMFEVITDTIPYPSFQKGKMSLFQFNNKIVGENLRPEFTMPIKESLKKLIIQCWSAEPNDRPTFEEIFGMLAFNLEDSVYDVFSGDSEYRFYLDGIDVEDVLDYAYEISEKSDGLSNHSVLNSIDQIVKENKQLKIDNEKLKSDNEKIMEKMKKYDSVISELVNDNKRLKSEVDELKKKISDHLNVDDKPIKKVDDKPVKKDDDSNIQTFSCQNINEFDGIMNFLVEKTGGNIHDNGTIEITSNSILSNDFHPKNLVDYRHVSCYQSLENSSSPAFICFDFKDKLIQPTSYSIKSGKFGRNGKNAHLRNWIIEVSQNGQNWQEIDRRDEDSNLNYNFAVYNFDIQKKETDFYRFIRLHLTGKTWCTNGDDNLVSFRKLEFYGKIKMQ